MSRQRFALQWWLTMASATLFFVSVSLVAAHLLGDREGLPPFLWMLAAVLIGDLVVALVYEAIAPTGVVVTPGERESNGDLSRERGIVVAGFGNDPTGRIRVRGEVWRARLNAGQSAELKHGDAVRIRSRDGLTLLVERGDSTR